MLDSSYVSEGGLQGGPGKRASCFVVGQKCAIANKRKQSGHSMCCYSIIYGESSTTSAASEIFNSIALTVMHLDEKKKVYVSATLNLKISLKKMLASFQGLTGPVHGSNWMIHYEI